MTLISKKKKIIYAISAVFAVGILSAVLPAIHNIIYPQTAAVTAAKKQLPIYCVDTGGKKQVAISFDAAWEELG